MSTLSQEGKGRAGGILKRNRKIINKAQKNCEKHETRKEGRKKDMKKRIQRKEHSKEERERAT